MLVRLAPGEERGSDDPAWRDSVVIVLRGSVEVGSARTRFGAGTVLALEGLCVRNPGPGEAVLATYARAFSHSALWSRLAAR